MALVYNIDFKANTSGVESQIKSLKQQLDAAFKRNTAAGFGLDKEVAAASKSAQALEKAMEKAYTSHGTSFITLNAELRKAGESVSSIVNNFASAGMHDAANDFLQMWTKADKTAITLNKHVQEMARVMTQSFKYMAAQQVFNFINQQIQSGIVWSKQMNEALTNIQIVTGETAEGMDHIYQTILKGSEALGIAAKEYAEAALIFYQQGLDTSSVEAMTDTTVRAAKVAGESLSQMSSELTTIQRNFKMTNEELENAASVGAKLGAETAVDFKYIAEAMQTTAQAAAQMGVSYETLSAIVATVGETSQQSASIVGNAFKTIFSRFENFKTTGEDEGVTLGQISTKLHDMGIEVLDAAGNMRDLEEVIIETGENWGRYSAKQQIAIAQIVGGTRQYAQFLTLMNNMDRMLELRDQAMSETGGETLAAQFDVWSDSIAAAAQRSSEAWQSAFANLFPQEGIKGFYNTLTSLGNFVSDFLQGFGGLPGILNTVGIILQDKIVSSLQSAVVYTAEIFRNRSTESSILYQNLQLQNSIYEAERRGDQASAEKLRVSQLFSAEITKQQQLAKSMNAEAASAAQAEIDKLARYQEQTNQLIDQEAAEEKIAKSKEKAVELAQKAADDQLKIYQEAKQKLDIDEQEIKALEKEIELRQKARKYADEANALDTRDEKGRFVPGHQDITKIQGANERTAEYLESSKSTEQLQAELKAKQEIRATDSLIVESEKEQLDIQKQVAQTTKVGAAEAKIKLQTTRGELDAHKDNNQEAIRRLNTEQQISSTYKSRLNAAQQVKAIDAEIAAIKERLVGKTDQEIAAEEQLRATANERLSVLQAEEQSLQNQRDFSISAEEQTQQWLNSENSRYEVLTQEYNELSKQATAILLIEEAEGKLTAEQQKELDLIQAKQRLNTEEREQIGLNIAELDQVLTKQKDITAEIQKRQNTNQTQQQEVQAQAKLPAGDKAELEYQKQVLEISKATVKQEEKLMSLSHSKDKATAEAARNQLAVLQGAKQEAIAAAEALKNQKAVLATAQDTAKTETAANTEKIRGLNAQKAFLQDMQNKGVITLDQARAGVAEINNQIGALENENQKHQEIIDKEQKELDLKQQNLDKTNEQVNAVSRAKMPTDLVAGMQTFVQGFTSVTMMMTSFSNAYVNTLKMMSGETEVTFGRILSLITNYGMALGQLMKVMDLFNLKQTLLNSGLTLSTIFQKEKTAATEADTVAEGANAVATTADTAAESANAVATGAAAAATTSEATAEVVDTGAKSANVVVTWLLNAAQAVLNSTMLVTVGIVLLVVAGIVALIAAINGIINLVKAFKAEQPEAVYQRTSEAVTQLTEKLNDLKSAAEQTQQAFDSYNTIVDKFKALTVGTDEWRAALEELNDQTLELLRIYPQLAGYQTEVNGATVISTAGQQVVSDEEQDRVRQAQRQQIAASGMMMEAQTEVKQKELVNEIKASNATLGKELASAIDVGIDPLTGEMIGVNALLTKMITEGEGNTQTYNKIAEFAAEQVINQKATNAQLKIIGNQLVEEAKEQGAGYKNGDLVASNAGRLYQELIDNFRKEQDVEGILDRSWNDTISLQALRRQYSEEVLGGAEINQFKVNRRDNTVTIKYVDETGAEQTLENIAYERIEAQLAAVAADKEIEQKLADFDAQVSKIANDNLNNFLSKGNLANLTYGEIKSLAAQGDEITDEDILELMGFDSENLDNVKSQLANLGYDTVEQFTGSVREALKVENSVGKAIDQWTQQMFMPNQTTLQTAAASGNKEAQKELTNRTKVLESLTGEQLGILKKAYDNMSAEEQDRLAATIENLSSLGEAGITELQVLVARYSKINWDTRDVDQSLITNLQAANDALSELETTAAKQDWAAQQYQTIAELNRQYQALAREGIGLVLESLEQLPSGFDKLNEAEQNAIIAANNLKIANNELAISQKNLADLQEKLKQRQTPDAEDDLTEKERAQKNYDEAVKELEGTKANRQTTTYKNLKAAVDEAKTELQQATDAENELQRQIDETTEAIKNNTLAVTENKEAYAAANADRQRIKLGITDIDQLNRAYEDGSITIAEYEILSKDLIKTNTDLNKVYKAGGISSSQYREKLLDLDYTVEDLDDAYRQGIINGTAYQNMLENVAAAALGSKEAYEIYKESLREEINTNRNVEAGEEGQITDTDLAAITNQLIAQQTAADNLKKTFSDYADVLGMTDEQVVKDIGLQQQQATAYGTIKNQLGALLGMDVNLIPDDLVKDRKNLELIKKAIDGDVEAMMQLRNLTAKQIMVNVGISDSVIKDKLGAVETMLNNLKKGGVIPLGIEFGSEDLGKIKSLAAILKATGQLSDNEVDEIFEGLGIRLQRVTAKSTVIDLMAASATHSIEDVQKKLGVLTAAAREATGEIIGATTIGTTTTGKEPGGTGATPTSKAEDIQKEIDASKLRAEQLEDEIDELDKINDRYSDQNALLTEQKDILDRVSKAKETASGTAKAALIYAETKQLNKLQQANANYLEDINNWMVRDIDTLLDFQEEFNSLGFDFEFEFNTEGAVSNAEEFYNTWDEYVDKIRQDEIDAKRAAEVELQAALILIDPLAENAQDLIDAVQEKYDAAIDAAEKATERLVEIGERGQEAIQQVAETTALKISKEAEIIDGFVTFIEQRVESAVYLRDLRIAINVKDIEIADALMRKYSDTAKNAAKRMDNIVKDWQSMNNEAGLMQGKFTRLKEIIDNIGFLDPSSAADQDWFIENVAGLNGVTNLTDEVRAEYAELWDTWRSTGGIPQSVLDALNATQDELIDLYNSYFDTYQEMWDEYIAMMEDFADQFSNAISKIDDALSLTSSMSEIWQTLGDPYNDSATSIMFLRQQADLATKKIQALNTELKVEREQADVTQADYQAALAENVNAAMRGLPEVYDELTIEGFRQAAEAAQNIVDETEKEFASAWQEFGSIITSNIEQQVAIIHREWSESLGAIFADIEEAMSVYDLKEETDTIYLDETNREYGISKLADQLTLDLEEITDPAVRKDYLAFLEKLNTKYGEGTKVTQAQLDILNLEYERLKLIAELQDEQNQRNKSTMRLTRDASGNYSYVYSAELGDNSYEETAQKIKDLDNEIYNANLEAAKSTEALWLQVQVSIDELNQLKQSQRYATDEAYREQIDAMYQLYTEQSAEYATIIDFHNTEIGRVFTETSLGFVTGFNTMEAAEAAYVQKHREESEIIQQTYRDWMEIAEETAASVGYNLSEMAQDMANETARINAYVDTTINKINEIATTSQTSFALANSYVTQMATTWNTTLKSIRDAIEDTIAKIQELNTLNAGGKTEFETTGIGNTYEKSDAETYLVNQSNINAYNNLKAMQTAGTLTMQTAAYLTAFEQIIANRKAAYEKTGSFTGVYGDTLNSPAGTVTVDQSFVAGMMTELSKLGLTTSTLTTAVTSNTAATEKASSLTVSLTAAQKDVINQLKDSSVAQDYQTALAIKANGNNSTAIQQLINAIENIAAARKSGGTWGDIEGAESWEALSNMLNKVSQYYPGFFNTYATGGYIEEPELALVGEAGKELILNPQDTKNILTAVAVMRSVVSDMSQAEEAEEPSGITVNIDGTENIVAAITTLTNVISSKSAAPEITIQKEINQELVFDPADIESILAAINTVTESISSKTFDIELADQEDHEKQITFDIEESDDIISAINQIRDLIADKFEVNIEVENEPVIPEVEVVNDQIISPNIEVTPEVDVEVVNDQTIAPEVKVDVVNDQPITNEINIVTEEPPPATTVVQVEKDDDNIAAKVAEPEQEDRSEDILSAIDKVRDSIDINTHLLENQKVAAPEVDVNVVNDQTITPEVDVEVVNDQIIAPEVYVNVFNDPEIVPEVNVEVVNDQTISHNVDIEVVNDQIIAPEVEVVNDQTISPEVDVEVVNDQTIAPEVDVNVINDQPITNEIEAVEPQVISEVQVIKEELTLSVGDLNSILSAVSSIREAIEVKAIDAETPDIEITEEINVDKDADLLSAVDSIRDSIAAYKPQAEPLDITVNTEERDNIAAVVADAPEPVVLVDTENILNAITDICNVIESKTVQVEIDENESVNELILNADELQSILSAIGNVQEAIEAKRSEPKTLTIEPPEIDVEMQNDKQELLEAVDDIRDTFEKKAEQKKEINVDVETTVETEAPIVNVDTTVETEAPIVNVDTTVETEAPIVNVDTIVEPPIVEVETTVEAPVLEQETTVETEAPIVNVETTVEPPEVNVETTVEAPSLTQETTVEPPIVNVDVAPEPPIISIENVVEQPPTVVEVAASEDDDNIAAKLAERPEPVDRSDEIISAIGEVRDSIDISIEPSKDINVAVETSNDETAKILEAVEGIKDHFDEKAKEHKRVEVQTEVENQVEAPVVNVEVNVETQTPIVDLNVENETPAVQLETETETPVVNIDTDDLLSVVTDIRDDIEDAAEPETVTDVEVVNEPQETPTVEVINEQPIPVSEVEVINEAAEAPEVDVLTEQAAPIVQVDVTNEQPIPVSEVEVINDQTIETPVTDVNIEAIAPDVQLTNEQTIEPEIEVNEEPIINIDGLDQILNSLLTIQSIIEEKWAEFKAQKIEIDNQVPEVNVDNTNEITTDEVLAAEQAKTIKEAQALWLELQGIRAELMEQMNTTQYATDADYRRSIDARISDIDSQISQTAQVITPEIAVEEVEIAPPVEAKQELPTLVSEIRDIVRARLMPIETAEPQEAEIETQEIAIKKREVLDAIEDMKQTVKMNFATLISSITTPSAATINNISNVSNQNQSTQQITINADFPNVSAAQEIQAAFANMYNQALQYAGQRR